ncbi:MAG: polymer-forming cytoskeletal protein [Polyangiaceae bacterium]|nr:polymer-forming cytoskeletal protein [Polyangiaceae bacterium]
MSNGDKRTLIEEGTDFRGSMSSSCPVVVKGRIEGELTTPSLTVARSGAVHGKANLGELTSEGELSGAFDADTVRLAGTVKDGTSIRAKSLEVKLEASDKMRVVFGDTTLSVGDEPRDEGGKRKRGE